MGVNDNVNKFKMSKEPTDLKFEVGAGEYERELKKEMERENKGKENTVIVDEYKEFMTYGLNRDFNNQVVYRFPNEHGASVINGYGSNGLELLTIYYHNEEDFERGNEQYGYLTKEELKDILTDIKNR